MRADLHTHTTASDGILSPQALVSRAMSQGVELLAITDHDTCAGVSAVLAQYSVAEAQIAKLQQSSEQPPLTLVSGIEFSAQWQGMGIHIVGLNMDLQNSEFQQRVEQQMQVRDHRAQEIGRRLERVGLENAYAGAKTLANGSQIGRPHFARLMVEQGIVKDEKRAFKKYLGAGKTGDVRCQWPEVAEVVEWINAANGVATLAHPSHYNMTRTKLRRLVEDFTESGGGAIEVVSGRLSVEEIGYYAQLAEKYGLYASCGSDFHRPDPYWPDLGEAAELPSHCRPVWEAF